MRSNLLKLRFLTSYSIGFLLKMNLMFAQNMVPNPSFEQHEVVLNSNIFYSDVLNWYSPSAGTPDYFHVQNTNYFSSSYGVPNNIIGYQNPFEGESYIGISTFVNQGQGTENAREYAQIKLTNPLINCGTYHLIFFTNLSDSVNYAVDKLGIALTPDSIFSNDFYCFTNVEPLIYVNKDSLLVKDRWVKTEMVFVAEGGEQFLTIGNFHLDDDLNITINNTSPNLNYEQSYYFVDDVSLISVAEASMPANGGPDIGLEIGDSVFIGQEISNLNCIWSVLGGAEIADSISGIWVQPTVTTTYVVEQNLCGTITYDTVTVFVHGVGLDENNTTDFLEVFPNPSAGKFYIQTNNISFIQISDLQGRSVNYSLNKFDDKTFEIEIDAENGIYNAQIVNEKIIQNVKIKILK